MWSLQARVLSGAQAGPSSYRTGAPCFFVQDASNEMRSSFRRRGGGYALPFTPEERLAEGGGRGLSLLQFARLQRGDDMAPPLRFRGPPRTVLGPEPGT